jgi:hypothetical protein
MVSNYWCICGSASTNVVVFLFEDVRWSNIITWSVFKESGGWLLRLQRKYKATPWGLSFLPWCVNVVLLQLQHLVHLNQKVSGYMDL